MKARMKLVAVTVSWALAAADSGLAAVVVAPNAGRAAPVPITAGMILTPGGGLSGSQLTLGGTLSMPSSRPTLPTGPMLRPGANAAPSVAASAANPNVSMDRAALPRAAVAVRAEEGATAAAEGMTPAGPAPLIKEARTGFRERLASLSRGIEGIAAHQAVSEQSGKLGRFFDAQAGQGTVRALVPAVAAEAAEPADPRWGERLWERLRDGADPALFGPIHDAIKARPADKQSGYALQYLYLFPIDMALPVLKEHLNGPFRGQVLMALKSYAVLAADPAQRRTADLHIYGEIKGMLPPNHALVDPEIEDAILKTFQGVTPKQQPLFFAGDERTYAMDLMAVIPSRRFASAAQNYLNAHWRDADTMLDDMKGRAGRIPSNPFSWFKGALDIAAAQATSKDAGFLADLDLKLTGLAAAVRMELDDFLKRDTLPWGWSVKPYAFRLDIIAGLRETVQEAIRRAGGEAVSGTSAKRFFGALAPGRSLNAVAAERVPAPAAVPEPTVGRRQAAGDVRATLRFTVGILSRAEAARGINAYLDSTGLKHRLSEDKGWLASDFVLAIEGTEASVRQHAEEVSRVLRRWPASSYDGVSFTPAWQVVPPWFDAGGLTFVRLGNAPDMSSSAVLRRGRYELRVSLDANGRGAAVFMKNALNPLGDVKIEDVALLTEALRKDIADILRAAQDVDPVSGDDKAVLNWMLAVLEDSSPAELASAEAPDDVLAAPAAAVPVPVQAHERRGSAAHALRLTNAVLAVGMLTGVIAALFVPGPSLALAAGAAVLVSLALTALDALAAVFEIPYAGWVLRAVGVVAALVFIAGIIGVIVFPS